MTTETELFLLLTLAIAGFVIAFGFGYWLGKRDADHFKDWK